MDIPARGAAPRVAYVAPQIGALTSTFIYREVQALRDLGLHVFTCSFTRPVRMSAEAEEILRGTPYLYEGRRWEPLRAAVCRLGRSPLRFARVFGLALRDALLGRVASPAGRVKVLWHFLVGCQLAEALRQNGIGHVHAHFAHMPTTVTMYAARLAGISFSFTGHANDLYVHGALLREKTARAAFTVCISEYNLRFLTEQGCDGRRMRIVRCGINTRDYGWKPLRTPDGAPRLLSVGRLVKKKGYATLIGALAMLRDRGRRFTCDIIGDGPLRSELEDLIRSNHLEGCVNLLGALPQEEVKEAFARADLFVLACEKAPDGDIDGIPVALMESMALGVPVVSTRLSGIPELVEDGGSGLLAEPGDSLSLANALESMLTDEAARLKRSAAARAMVEREFDSAVNARRMAALFEETLRDGARGEQGAGHG